MEQKEKAALEHKLISALTQYDLKQSGKRFYNPHALGIYFQRVDDIMADIEAGATPRAAILAGFNDRLLDFVLRAIGEPISTKEELRGGSYVYTPAKA